MGIQSSVLAAVLTASVALLGGCKASPSVEVYLSDVVAVAAGETKPVTATAQIAFEVMTKAKCEEDQAKLVGILSRQFDAVKDFTCADPPKGGLYAEARFTTKLPIVAFNDKGEVRLSRLLTVAVERRPQEGGLSVNLFLSQPAMKSLAADIRQLYMYDIGRGDIGAARVVVVNDLPADSDVTGSVSYVNGAPRPFRWKQALPRREKLEIGLSNVHADALRTGAAVPVFLIPAK